MQPPREAPPGMTPAYWLRSLTILQRVTFALMVAAALNLAVRLAVGAPDLSGHAGNLLIAVLLFLLSRLRLWRVRTRLLVSYVLFGVVPLAIVVMLGIVAATTLFGLIAADSVLRSLDDRTREMTTLAREVATVASSRGALDLPMLSRLVTGLQPGARAIVTVGDVVRSIPDEAGPLRGMPAWRARDFAGLFEQDDSYFIGGHAQDGQPAADVFVYAPMTQ